MYIPRFLHVRPDPVAFPLLSPLVIIHHAVRYTARGRIVHVSLLYSAFLEHAQLPLHNQLVLSCPEYPICMNFIAADLSYLDSIDLGWITRVEPWYYQVHVYKICKTQSLMWNIQRTGRVIQLLSFIGWGDSQQEVFIYKYLALHIS